MKTKAKGGDGPPTPAQMRKAAQGLSQTALDTLSQIMTSDGQVSVRLSAAREVLDRGFGKPEAAKARRARAAKPKDPGLTIIVKRFSDVTPEEEAAAEATERGEL